MRLFMFRPGIHLPAKTTGFLRYDLYFFRYETRGLPVPVHWLEGHICDDEILERVLKQHEESQNDDFVDILLKVYQDYKAKFKISRTCTSQSFLASVQDDNDEDEKIRQLVKENLEDGVQEGHICDDEILERVLKQHEESQNDDFVDILLKVYQDYKAEFKISRTCTSQSFLASKSLNHGTTSILIS
ncbi:hypothetical protein CFP56_007305 [Quercus suber]|uniref:Uncharacterized protein n=1 Tax=Quercus suber TaxID=58331 RepID=A0AAW0L8E8_QUESU